MRAALTAIALATLSTSMADAAQWQVDSAKSKLSYVVVWAKEPFKADFKKWTADIDFDPADLAHAKVKRDRRHIVGMVSEDPENDKYRIGPMASISCTLPRRALSAVVPQPGAKPLRSDRGLDPSQASARK
jgi:hypothetical protein